ncbi:MAG: recombinase family protein, partial [Microgenomates group bacterium]
NSLPAQAARLEQYCQRKEYQIDKTFSFDESAYKDKRNDFDEILNYIISQKDKIAVCFDKVDRLSRNIFDTRVSNLYEMALRDEIELHFVSDGQIINSQISAVEKFQFGINLGLAKYFSDAISDNVKRSREQILRDGRLPGKAPFGYVNAKKDEDTNWIFVDPMKSHIVKEMFQLYASKAYSMDTLRDKMNTTYGIKLSKGHVDQILRRKFYHGIIETQGKEYPHVYETILTEDEYNKVQEVKTSFQKKTFKYKGLPYVYRGLMQCVDCDCMITPEKKKGKYIYYHCTQHKYKHKISWVSESEITEQFADAFKSIKIPDEVLEKLTETLKSTHEGKQQYFNEIQQKLSKEYQNYQTKKDNLLDMKISGRITNDIYDKKFNELQTAQGKIKSKLNNLHYADKDYFITASYLLDLANRAHELFVSSEMEQKRQLITLVFQNLKLEGRTVRYDYVKPFDQIFFYADRNLWLPRVDSNHEP